MTAPTPKVSLKDELVLIGCLTALILALTAAGFGFVMAADFFWREVVCEAVVCQ